MLTRRELMGKAAVGAAAALAVGGMGTAAVAATRPRREPRGKAAGTALDGPAVSEAVTPPALDRLPVAPGSEVVDAAPAPWALVAPYGAGAAVAHGWTLVHLTPVRDGAAVVTLQNARGHAQRIHLCRNDGQPQGVLHTRQVDLVMMNQGYGDLPTEEHFGQAVAMLAHAIAANETAAAVAELLPHRARLERFAAIEGPAADGKLR